MSEHEGNGRALRRPRPAEAEVEVSGRPETSVVARGATTEEGRASAQRVSRAVAEQLIEAGRRGIPSAVPDLPQPTGRAELQDRPNDARRRRGPGSRVHRLRVDWHDATPAALTGLTRRIAPTGVLIGRGTDGTQMRASLFRSTPARLIVIGQHRLGRLLLLRAAAAGARPVVLADALGAWEEFAARLGQTGTGTTVLPAEAPFLMGGSGTEPLFVLHSADEDPATAFEEMSQEGWRCDAVLTPRISPEVLTALRLGGLLVTGRLGAQDAARLCATRLVGELTPDVLTGLSDDTVAVVADGRARMMRVEESPGEEALLGLPWH
ncbi:hypothetical protein GCM10022223_39160 [Kineosporia mesophila]|uniref:Uncharacterized protein n=1 Tax=Kineosporia mesophila TaxID=566012 RepID=A0ABP6ZVM2_9ACTN|nr:hypothetical protein [Kineosporia mesophila]MCD5348540.1 hypothetical protein [Kineosporia mesophila]